MPISLRGSMRPVLMLLGTLLIAFAAAPASAIDLKKNPGCGETGLTREQKIERNRRLAEFYYQGYVEAPKTRRLANFGDFKCWAEGATILAGVLDPLGQPKSYPGDMNSLGGGQTEIKAYWTVIPDFGAQPGTFVAYPAENGVMWRQMHGGHTRDGKPVTVWEVCYISVNDAGLITHYETWVDSIGMAKVIELYSGKKMENMTLNDYAKSLGDAAKE